MLKTQPMHNNSILFLVNQKAGKGLPNHFEVTLKSIIDQAKVRYELAYSKHADHFTELAKNGIKKGFNKIVVVGGDGSINEVFRQLVGTKVKLGVLPFGSGNGLARHLKIPLDLPKALQVILNGNTKQIDSGRIYKIPFLSIAGTGFDARIARDFEQSKSRGFNSYFRLVLKHFFNYKSETYHLEIDDRKLTQKAFMINFANSNQFGYDFQIAPQAVIDDGFIDICILTKPPLFMIPFTALKFIRKRIHSSKYYQSFKAKKIKLKGNSELPVNIDGEYHQSTSEITIEVLPKSIEIIVP